MDRVGHGPQERHADAKARLVFRGIGIGIPVVAAPAPVTLGADLAAPSEEQTEPGDDLGARSRCSGVEHDKTPKTHKRRQRLPIDPTPSAWAAGISLSAGRINRRDEIPSRNRGLWIDPQYAPITRKNGPPWSSSRRANSSSLNRVKL